MTLVQVCARDTRDAEAQPCEQVCDSIKADIAVGRPYPRHRGDPYLADLRKQILGLLGLEATW